MHEVRRHRYKRPISKYEVRPIAEFLDAGKNVIPATAVQPGRMVAQFVEVFVHFECGWNCLDQYSCSNRTAWNSKFILGEIEGVIPDACLEVALHFRQVEIRAAAASY